MLNQQFQEPFVALVIDPHRTASNGKVEIGAFRTFPEGYNNNSASRNAGGASVGASFGERGMGGSGGQRVSGSSINDGGGSYQPIPLSKMEDFGAYANQYYQLEISYFKSSLDTSLMDLLWNKYWVDTLSNTPMISGNQSHRDFLSGQIKDLGKEGHELYSMSCT